MVVTRAALTARVGFLVSMAAMSAALTTGAVYLISMENIKVGLKSDESEKGARLEYFMIILEHKFAEKLS
jgi:hypothetical protein